ncbi:FAD-dependent oxidoreductase domain-containing protein 1-like [Palaemon carinicauda]|uniref:FAD-dependent oxidoreductase domain-containing protein 1-like n=1 Tax=Palaemon carinicauda TaxID=392227 RepID=UPI0035B5AD39
MAALRSLLTSSQPKFLSASLAPWYCVQSLSFRNGKIFKSLFHTTTVLSKKCDNIPRKCDVLIVGGGAMGSSIAYHLKKEAGKDLSVVVIEADNTYKKASTVLSMGCIRQQFTVPENIYLSMYGRQFLKEAHHLLRVPDFDPPDVQFHPCGYLMLVTEAGYDQLMENYKIQVDAGAKLEMMTQSQLKRKYPYMVTDDIALAVVGIENEGWFDPWTLLMGFRRKATSLGAVYVHGKVTDINDRFNAPAQNLNVAQVTTSDGETHDIEFSTIVIAAGTWSGEVSELAGIGTGEGLLATPLPVEPRKRYVYCAHVPEGPIENCPILCDHTGAHFRPDVIPKVYLCIRNPSAEEEPPTEDLEVDHDYFNHIIWPQLANRIPAFENLKVRGSWAGYYDYNTLDQNAVIGKHPVYSNLIFATGFSGHGIQHSPGTGRAIMEYLLHGGYRSINLERFGFERILNNEPIIEKNVL